MGWSKTEIEDLARRIEERFPPLSHEERRIALSVYRELARGRPVASGAVAGEAGVATAKVEEAVERWPGVFRDRQGRVVGFWGLALQEMPNPIRVGDRTLYAWCAWDTLFLGELLGRDIEVEGKCAATGRPVRWSAGAEGVRDVNPDTAVISFVDPDQCDVEGDRVISTFCHHILFFSSVEEWERWAGDRPPGTFPLTVQEGWWLGRSVNRLRYGSELSDEPLTNLSTLTLSTPSPSAPSRRCGR